MRQYVRTNVQSPACYRTDGIGRSVDAWYTAFNVKPGDALYVSPEQRVHIW